MKRFFIVLLLIISAACIGVSIFFLLNPEPEGQKRQKIEESLADAYLAHLELINKGENIVEEESAAAASPQQTTAEAQTPAAETVRSSEAESEEPESASEEEEESADSENNPWISTSSVKMTAAEYEDVNYYQRGGITYTPDYARGEIIGVLEIPKAQIRRGIYGGTWEDIVHDLDIWMVTEARPDYVLGDTHFCIYGHNHTVQDLSFNRLKYVQPGDSFTITDESGVWEYDVTDFFADWREIVTSDVVDNFNLPKDKCYIITCGRDEYRYKDIVVVGTLRKDPRKADDEEETSEEDAEESAVWQSAETKPDETETPAASPASAEAIESASETTEPESTEPLRQTRLLLDYSRGMKVSLVGPDNEPVDARVILVDEDGLFVEEWSEAVHTLRTELPLNTEFLISAFSEKTMPDGYDVPKEVVFTLKGNGSFHEEELSPIQEDVPSWAKYSIIGLSSLLAIMIIIFVIILLKKK